MISISLVVGWHMISLAHDFIHTDLNIVSHTHQEMNIAKNVASLVVGWELGEYGKPRDAPLPWAPDLSALALDTELAQMMNKIMEDTLNLNSASDVSVMCKF